MSRLHLEEKIKSYYKLFEQIYKSPTMPLYEIEMGTGISQTTISKYLKDMYAKGILVGPYIEMKPTLNYREYLYLMNFKNPITVFRKIEGFPHVLSYATCFGAWNTMVVTDKSLDFSKLVGYQKTIYQGAKGYTYTPKVEYTTWDEAFKQSAEYIDNFSDSPEDKIRSIDPTLHWEEKQWKLFYSFQRNLRQTATPILRKIEVRRDTFSWWKRTLRNHCTVHTEFYPDGYQKYNHYCFLLSSDHEESVRTVFSFFPTTSVMIEVGNQLLVFLKVNSADRTRKMFRTVYKLKVKGMMKGFKQANTVLDSSNLIPQRSKRLETQDQIQIEII